jgi:hypothetical protein
MGIQQCVRFALLCHTSPTIMLKWLCDVAYNNKTYWCLLTKWPIFLSDCNHVWTSCTDFHKSHQYQISRKYIRWKPSWYMRTDGRAGGRTLKRIGAFLVNANAPKMVLQTHLCSKPETATCSSTRPWVDFYKEHLLTSQKFAKVNKKFPALYGILPARVHHWILPWAK